MLFKKVGFACDHAGLTYKNQLFDYVGEKGYITCDFSRFKDTEKVDYPKYAHNLAKAVQDGSVDVGILLCGSGNGVAMTANKHESIRAAICWDENISELARKHNDANILCLPARFISLEKAKKLVDVFLETGFEGGRHARRVALIPIQ